MFPVTGFEMAEYVTGLLEFLVGLIAILLPLGMVYGVIRMIVKNAKKIS